MGSRTDRYKVKPNSQWEYGGSCRKVMALDTRTGNTVMLKSGTHRDLGYTPDEYRAAIAARACGVPVVVGRWTRSNAVTDPEVRPHYVIDMIPGAMTLIGKELEWSHQMQVDWLRIQAFAWVVGEGDRHGGNHLVVDGRVLAIDLAFLGHLTSFRGIIAADAPVDKITKDDIRSIVQSMQDGRPAIERLADQATLRPTGWEGRLGQLHQTLSEYVETQR